jgi:hypothetical protein
MLCPEADAEIDFETGSILRNDSDSKLKKIIKNDENFFCFKIGLSFNDHRILPAYEKFFRDNGIFQCSKSAVLKENGSLVFLTKSQ